MMDFGGLIRALNSEGVTAFINLAFFLGLLWAFLGKALWRKATSALSRFSERATELEIERWQLELVLIRQVRSSQGAARYALVSIYQFLKWSIFSALFFFTSVLDVYIFDVGMGEDSILHWVPILIGGSLLIFASATFIGSLTNVLKWHGYQSQFSAIALRKILIARYQQRRSDIEKIRSAIASANELLE